MGAGHSNVHARVRAHAKVEAVAPSGTAHEDPTSSHVHPAWSDGPQGPSPTVHDGYTPSHHRQTSTLSALRNSIRNREAVVFNPETQDVESEHRTPTYSRATYGQRREKQKRDVAKTDTSGVGSEETKKGSDINSEKPSNADMEVDIIGNSLFFPHTKEAVRAFPNGRANNSSSTAVEGSSPIQQVGARTTASASRDEPRTVQLFVPRGDGWTQKSNNDARLEEKSQNEDNKAERRKPTSKSNRTKHRHPLRNALMKIRAVKTISHSSTLEAINGFVHSTGGRRLIRLYVATSPSDMFTERQLVALRVFPTLSAHCQTKGLRLMICDVRCGLDASALKESPGAAQAALSEMRRTVASSVSHKFEENHSHVHEVLHKKSHSHLAVTTQCNPFFIGFYSRRFGWIPNLDKDVAVSVVDSLGWDQGTSLLERETSLLGLGGFGELGVQEGNRNALFCFRDLGGIDDDEDDGQQQHSPAVGNRRSKVAERFVEPRASEADVKLKELQQKIWLLAESDQCYTYSAHVPEQTNVAGVGSVVLRDTEELRAKIVEKMTEYIDREFPDAQYQPLKEATVDRSRLQRSVAAVEDEDESRWIAEHAQSISLNRRKGAAERSAAAQELAASVWPAMLRAVFESSSLSGTAFASKQTSMPFAVVGGHGSGKSSLLAKLVEELRELGGSGLEALEFSAKSPCDRSTVQGSSLVVTCFVASSPSLVYTHDALTHILRQLGAPSTTHELALPTLYTSETTLASALPDALYNATFVRTPTGRLSHTLENARRDVYLVIDGIEFLRDLPGHHHPIQDLHSHEHRHGRHSSHHEHAKAHSGRRMPDIHKGNSGWWIPRHLPANVHLILSTSPSCALLGHLQHLFPHMRVLPLAGHRPWTGTGPNSDNASPSSQHTGNERCVRESSSSWSAVMHQLALHLPKSQSTVFTQSIATQLPVVLEEGASSSRCPLWIALATHELGLISGVGQADSQQVLLDPTWRTNAFLSLPATVDELCISVYESIDKATNGVSSKILALVGLSHAGLLEAEIAALALSTAEFDTLPFSSSQSHIGSGALAALESIFSASLLGEIFFTSREGLVMFAHHRFRSVARAKYIATKENAANVSNHMTNFYEGELKAILATGGSSFTDISRVASELPHQLSLLSDHNRVAEVLTTWQVFDAISSKASTCPSSLMELVHWWQLGGQSLVNKAPEMMSKMIHSLPPVSALSLAGFYSRAMDFLLRLGSSPPNPFLSASDPDRDRSASTESRMDAPKSRGTDWCVLPQPFLSTLSTMAQEALPLISEDPNGQTYISSVVTAEILLKCASSATATLRATVDKPTERKNLPWYVGVEAKRKSTSKQAYAGGRDFEFDEDVNEVHTILTAAMQVFKDVGVDIASCNSFVEVVSVLDAVGTMQLKRGRHERAKALFELSRSVFVRAYGSFHTSVAGSLDQIGLCLVGEHKFSEAIAVMEEALAIREAIHGEDNIHVANSCLRIASVTRGQSFLAVVTLYKRALNVYERKFGNESPKLLSVLDLFAEYLLEKKEYENAVKLTIRSFSILTAIPLKTVKTAVSEWVREVGEHFMTIVRTASRMALEGSRSVATSHVLMLTKSFDTWADKTILQLESDGRQGEARRFFHAIIHPSEVLVGSSLVPDSALGACVRLIDAALVGDKGYKQQKKKEIESRKDGKGPQENNEKKSGVVIAVEVAKEDENTPSDISASKDEKTIESAPGSTLHDHIQESVDHLTVRGSSDDVHAHFHSMVSPATLKKGADPVVSPVTWKAMKSDGGNLAQAKLFEVVSSTSKEKTDVQTTESPGGGTPKEGQRSHTLASTFKKLGLNYFENGEFTKADDAFEQAITIYEDYCEYVGGSHAINEDGEWTEEGEVPPECVYPFRESEELADTFKLLGSSQLEEGDLGGARSSLGTALNIYEAKHSDSIETAKLYDVICTLSAMEEKMDEAIRCARKAALTRKHLLGQKNASFASSMERLSDLEAQVGRFDDAYKHLRKCLLVRKIVSPSATRLLRATTEKCLGILRRPEMEGMEGRNADIIELDGQLEKLCVEEAQLGRTIGQNF